MTEVANLLPHFCSFFLSTVAEKSHLKYNVVLVECACSRCGWGIGEGGDNKAWMEGTNGSRVECCPSFTNGEYYIGDKDKPTKARRIAY